MLFSTYLNTNLPTLAEFLLTAQQKNMLFSLNLESIIKLFNFLNPNRYKFKNDDEKLLITFYSASQEKDCFYTLLLSFAHDLDLHRCCDNDDYKEKMENYNKFIRNSHEANATLENLKLYAIHLHEKLNNADLRVPCHNPNLFKRPNRISILRLRQICDTATSPSIVPRCLQHPSPSLCTSSP